MKSMYKMLIALAVLVVPTVAMAEEFPVPSAEHIWLQQFIGEWESENTLYMDPSKAPVKTTGTETVRPLGQFWTVSEIKGVMMDRPFIGNLTLGYDPMKQKYVGTWVDSVTGHLWEYEGNVDVTGKTLTLETEGVCPMRPGKMTRFKETVQFQDKDHKVFTSSMLDDNGRWVTTMTSQAVRKD